MDERVVDFVLLPLAGRGLSKWRLHCWVIHPDPEGALRGPVPLQQVPHLCSREDGEGGSAQQAGRGELQRPLQDWALRWVLDNFNRPNNGPLWCHDNRMKRRNLCSLAHHINPSFCTVCHDKTGSPTLLSDIWLSHVLIVLGMNWIFLENWWMDYKGLDRWTVYTKN